MTPGTITAFPIPSSCPLAVRVASKKVKNTRPSALSSKSVSQECVLPEVARVWFAGAYCCPSLNEVMRHIKGGAVTTLILHLEVAVREETQNPYNDAHTLVGRLDLWCEAVAALKNIIWSLDHYKDLNLPELLSARDQLMGQAHLIIKALRLCPFNHYNLPGKLYFHDSVRHILIFVINKYGDRIKEDVYLDTHMTALGLTADAFLNPPKMGYTALEKDFANSFPIFVGNILKGIREKCIEQSSKVTLSTIPSFPLEDFVEYCSKTINDKAAKLSKRYTCAEISVNLPDCDSSPEVFNALVQNKPFTSTRKLIPELPAPQEGLQCSCGDSTSGDKTDANRVRDFLLDFWRDMLKGAKTYGRADDLVRDFTNASIIPVLRDWIDILDEDDLDSIKDVDTIVTDLIGLAENDQ